MSLRAFTETECKVWSVRTWRHGRQSPDILVFQNNETVAMLVNQTCGSSTFYLWNTFFQSDKFAWLLDMWVNTLYNLAYSRNHDGLSLFALICASTRSIQKVKPAHKPSDPTGQSLSWFQKHEETESISTPPEWDSKFIRWLHPNFKFARTHLNIWVERGTVRVKYLAQQHNTMLGLAPWLLPAESGRLIMKRLRLPNPISMSRSDIVIIMGDLFKTVCASTISLKIIFLNKWFFSTIIGR